MALILKSRIQKDQMKNILIMILLAALIIVGYQYQTTIKSDKAIVKNDPLLLTSNQPDDNHHPKAIEKSHKQNTKLDHDKKTLNNDDNHGHIDEEIRTVLCIETESFSNQCTVNTDINIQAAMVNDVTGNINTEEVSTIIASSNFSDILDHLTTNKSLTESFEREVAYNSQLNDIINTLEVSSQGIYCGDISCATSLSYKDDASWHTFKKEFFTPNNNKGNLFISQLPKNVYEDYQVRIIFFPDNNKAVTKRLKKTVSGQ
jgi:hypothetical protein